MFSTVKAYLFAGIAIAILVAVGIFAWQYNSLTNENKQLVASNAQLKIAVQTQQETIDYINKRVKTLIESNTKLNSDLSDAEQRAAQENKVVLDSLNSQNPQELQDEINGLFENFNNSISRLTSKQLHNDNGNNK